MLGTKNPPALSAETRRLGKARSPPAATQRPGVKKLLNTLHAVKGSNDDQHRHLCRLLTAAVKRPVPVGARAFSSGYSAVPLSKTNRATACGRQHPWLCVEASP